MKKKIFAFILTAVLSIAGVVAAHAEAPEGSIAYFSFDGTVDEATPVTVKFAPADKKTWTYVDGKIGKALHVNPNGSDNIGLDTNVVIGDGSYTVSFWAQANTSSFACPLVFIGHTDQWTNESWNAIWQGLSYGWNAGTSGAGSNDATAQRVGITASFNNDTSFSFDWTYITLTVDTAKNHTAVLYLDGKYVAFAEKFGALTKDAKLYVGTNYWDNPCDFYIDELCVFDRALSESEVSALAASAGVGASMEPDTPAVEPTTAPSKVNPKDENESLFFSISVIIVVAGLIITAVLAVIMLKKTK